ncbi:MAG: hypothetical protein AMXMBFR84_29640 [Candidatus Hydrogenedentota bacterium]
MYSRPTKCLCIVVCLCFGLASLRAGAEGAEPADAENVILLQATPTEYIGGHPSLPTEKEIEGDITISTQSIQFQSKNGTFEIDPNLVTKLSGGEYAKRRVKGALIGTVLLGPLFLFALVGKKKRDILVIEYSTEKLTAEEGQEPKLSGAAILRYKPKDGRAIAIESAIETVTGLQVQKEDMAEDTKEGKKKGEQ